MAEKSAAPAPVLIPGCFLSDKDVAAIFRVSRGQVWEMTRQGYLPEPRRLSARTTRWSSDSIIQKLNQAA